MMNQLLKDKLQALPSSPGCYLMKNDAHAIIYIGKAKNLYKRVNSYFQKAHSGKTQKMVSEILDFDVIITNSEKEALILELNLVQLHNPRYNVLLKDGKTYPYIQVKKTKHPIIKIARNTKDKDSKYYGPYPDSQAAFSILHLLQQIFPLRKCRNVPKKPCLYYYLGQCLAPCIQVVEQTQYDTILADIHAFMSGNIGQVRKELYDKMQSHAEKLEYEQASEIKKLVDNIDYMQSGQSVQLDTAQDVDVFAFHVQNEHISIATLIVRGGKLLTKINQILPLYNEEEETLTSYIMQFYAKNILPKLIILPKKSEQAALSEALDRKVIAPTRGKHYELLMMAAQNALKGMTDNQLKLLVNTHDTNEVIDELAKRLQIPYPKQIDFIDNSHTAGDDFVSAVVVFINGIPNKKMYRKYKINSLHKGADDKAMYEVVYRRFYRHLVENRSFCDLLLVDGGMIQVRAAKQALLDLKVAIPVFGVVKDLRHRTQAIVDYNNQVFSLQDHRPLLFLLSKMQDEVHRYVIQFHRSSRSKSMIASLLDGIDGLGPVRKRNLLKIYGTVNKIKEASVDELAQYVPKNVAINIKTALNDENG